MSQSKVQKITIRNRPGAEGKTTCGSNTQVLLDGVPIRGASFVKFEVHAAKMAKVTIEMFAEVELEIEAELEKHEKESTKLVNAKGKPIGIYTLSSYFPQAIVYKKE
jgi:hypothetical protein